jgi:hypothetical protein
MSPARASYRLQTVGWIVVSGMALSALDGMLCSSRPEAEHTV